MGLGFFTAFAIAFIVAVLFGDVFSVTYTQPSPAGLVAAVLLGKIGYVTMIPILISQCFGGFCGIVIWASLFNGSADAIEDKVDEKEYKDDEEDEEDELA